MGNENLSASRRVLVGVNAAGASAVVTDEKDLPVTKLPNGIVLQELWQQPTIPARPDDSPEPERNLGPDAPMTGAVVRILTVPTASRDHTVPDLHTDMSLHVITMLSGELVILLEDGEVALKAGDSVVLRGSMHDLRNAGSVPATFVYTSFPLAMDALSRR